MAKERIVHGDLHFDNIMFPEFGRVRFGKKEPLRVEIPEIPDAGELVIKDEDRIIKIFDWDRSHEAEDEHDLLRDRIGFLRLLPRYAEDFFPIADAMGKDLHAKYDEYVVKTVVVNDMGRAYQQETDVAKLRALGVSIDELREWVEKSIRSLKRKAYESC